MDIKNKFFDIIDMDSASYKYSGLAVEKLVSTVVCDYISKQGKKAFTNYTVKETNGMWEHDIYAPEGFDDYIGETVLEIKIIRHRNQYKRMLYNTVKRLAKLPSKVRNVIIIVVGESSDEINEQVIKNSNTTFELSIWTVDKLTEISEGNMDSFLNTYDSLYAFLIKNTISQGMNRDSKDYENEKQAYIEQLKEEYHDDNLVLFLGAGVSRDAKISTWDALISELFVALINQEMNKEGIVLSESDKKQIIKSIQNQNGYSPLLQTRFLRQGFKDDFLDLVRDILYKNSISTSKLLEEIGQLCIPKRGKTGIKAIINYNFDDLIEKNLDLLRIKYHSVYSDGIKTNSDELGIYHVHGFLPQSEEDYKDLEKSLLVFSEEGYHKLLLEPYNWANMNQLNFLTNDTCLFIGLSMTDPNLRRLLEISSQKDIEGDPNHYAIMKRSIIENRANMSRDVLIFNQVNEELQKSFFNELGINIIWIDDYDEIPSILKSIKG